MQNAHLDATPAPFVGSLPPVRSLRLRLVQWAGRRLRQRRALEHLKASEDWLLEDIGLTREEIERAVRGQQPRHR